MIEAFPLLVSVLQYERDVDDFLRRTSYGVNKHRGRDRDHDREHRDRDHERDRSRDYDKDRHRHRDRRWSFLPALFVFVSCVNTSETLFKSSLWVPVMACQVELSSCLCDQNKAEEISWRKLLFKYLTYCLILVWSSLCRERSDILLWYYFCCCWCCCCWSLA